MDEQGRDILVGDMLIEIVTKLRVAITSFRGITLTVFFPKELTGDMPFLELCGVMGKLLLKMEISRIGGGWRF